MSENLDSTFGTKIEQQHPPVTQQQDTDKELTQTSSSSIRFLKIVGAVYLGISIFTGILYIFSSMGDQINSIPGRHSDAKSYLGLGITWILQGLIVFTVFRSLGVIIQNLLAIREKLNRS